MLAMAGANANRLSEASNSTSMVTEGEADRTGGRKTQSKDKEMPAPAQEYL